MNRRYIVLAGILLAFSGPARGEPQSRCEGVPEMRDQSGAYFREIASLPGAAGRGIAAEGELPRFMADLARYFTPADEKLERQIGPLDRASLYLGASGGGKEFAAGLAWSRVYDSQGRPAFTDNPGGSDGRDPKRRFVRAVVDGEPVLQDGEGSVIVKGAPRVRAAARRLQPDFAFAPFWGAAGLGSALSTGAAPNAYFYPGEKFSMTLRLIKNSTFQWDISVPGGGPERSFSSVFKAEAFTRRAAGTGRVFKRVDSIDQLALDKSEAKGNEGRGVVPTKAKALGLRWERVAVLQDDGARVPLAGKACREVRGRDVAPVHDHIFQLSGFTADGGESVDIVPDGAPAAGAR